MWYRTFQYYDVLHIEKHNKIKFMLFFNPKLLLNSVKQWVTDFTGNLEAISPNPSIALIIFTFLEIKKTPYFVVKC